METMNPAVEYRAYPGISFDLLRVGKDGSIWVFRARSGRWDRWRMRFKKGRPYLGVTLGDRRLHVAWGHAVLAAFGLPRPGAAHAVGYRDGDATNNRLSNLRWMPIHCEQIGWQPEQFKGRVFRGSQHARAKLTEEKVAEARRRYKAGELVEELAEEFGVSATTVRNAIFGATWRHVHETPPTACNPSSTVGAWNPRARLDDFDILKIRRMADCGSAIQSIADAFEIGYTTVRDIVDGKTWKHAGGPIRDPSLPRLRGRPSKLTPGDVIRIREMVSVGMSMRKIAKIFKVSRETIRRIVRRETWRDVG